MLQFGEPSGYLFIPFNHRSISVLRRRPSQMCWRQPSLHPALQLTWGALYRVISVARDLLLNRRSSICRVSQPRPVHPSNLSMTTCLAAESAYVCCFSFQSHAFWWVTTSRTACRPTSKKVRNTQWVWRDRVCNSRVELETWSSHSVRSRVCSFFSLKCCFASFAV